jgi:hypothetical protein
MFLLASELHPPYRARHRRRRSRESRWIMLGTAAAACFAVLIGVGW